MTNNDITLAFIALALAGGANAAIYYAGKLIAGCLMSKTRRVPYAGTWGDGETTV